MSRPPVIAGRLYWIRTGEGHVSVGRFSMEEHNPGISPWMVLRGDLSSRGLPDAIDVRDGVCVGDWFTVRDGNGTRHLEVIALIEPPKKATSRQPRIGETWLTAACGALAKPAGACCFCNRRILPEHGLRAVRGKEQAHYDCAPGLGIPPVRA